MNAKKRWQTWGGNRGKAWRLGLAVLFICLGIGLTAGAADWYVDDEGDLFFSQDWNGSGLFLLDTSTGSAVHVGLSGVTTRTVGLAPGDNPSELFGSLPWDLARIAVDGTGPNIISGWTGIEGLAYDVGNDVLYAIWGTIDRFMVLDSMTGALVEYLPGPGVDVEALAYDPSRNLVYGIGGGTTLLAYDPVTRTWSSVGDTGVNWDDCGLAYDPKADVLYAVGLAVGDNLYTIDPATAAVSVVGPTTISPTAGGLAFLLWTIQQTIDAAAPGDTIHVQVGTYHENIVVDKKLKILADPGAVLDGDGGYAATIDANKVVFSGFEIIDSHWSGVVVLGNKNTVKNIVAHDNFIGLAIDFSDKNTLTKNEVYDNAWAGITLWQATQNTVSKNDIHDNPMGIKLISADNNTIKKNDIYDNGTGIDLDPSHNNTIINNSIFNNETGVWIHDSSTGNQVLQNLIYNNGIGVFINEGATSNLVAGNQLWGNYMDGVWIEEAAGNTVSNNWIVNNAGAVYLRFADANDIVGNLLADSWQWNGLGLTFSNGNWVYDNVITGNAMGGIWLKASNTNTIESNTVFDNRFTGIGLGDGSTLNTIVDNDIVQNDEHGVLLSNGSNWNEILGNWILGNGGSGVFLYDSHGNTIDINEIGNNEHGVFLEESDGNDILRNWVYGSTHSGVLLIDSNNNWIWANRLQNNGAGVFIAQSKFNDVIRNYIANNTHEGVGLEDARRNTVAGNEILGSNNGIYLGNADWNKILNNFIHDNLAGISLEESDHNLVARNRVVHNEDGIVLHLSNWNRLIDNFVANSLYNGVLLMDSDGNRIAHCRVTRNRDSGVALGSLSDHNVVVENRIYNNRGAGLHLYDAWWNTVERNQIYGNRWVGMFVGESLYNEILNNEIYGNRNAGVALQDSDENLLQGNVIHHNRRQGIQLGSAEWNEIVANVVYRNLRQGIALMDSHHNTISHNDIFGNHGGILLEHSDVNEIVWNWIRHNGYAGIYLYDSDGNFIAYNTIQGHHTGIKLDDSVGNTLLGNLLTGNVVGIDVDPSMLNRIEGNEIAYNGTGIYLFDSSVNHIVDNWIHHNGVGIEGEGIYDTLFEGNLIENNGAGIWLHPYGGGNTIVGNTIQGNGTGLLFDWSDGNDLSANEITGNGIGADLVLSWSEDFTNNLISGNGTGIVQRNFGLGNEAHYNAFVGNTVAGIDNQDPEAMCVFDAILNWWGSVNGPTADHNGDGVPDYNGGGDWVIGNVIYSPWLGIGTDADPAIGWQPVSPMLYIVDDVGPRPAVGYLNAAIAAANLFAGPDTIEVRHGTYGGDWPITEAVTIKSETGSAAHTHLLGNLSLDASNILLGGFRNGFTVHGDVTVLGGHDASAIHINWNDLLGLVSNGGLNILDATFNWWGGNHPATRTIGFVDYWPWLALPSDTIIGFVDLYRLSIPDAMTLGELVAAGLTEAEALVALEVMNTCGYTMEEAITLVEEVGWIRVASALRRAMGDCEQFAIQLAGYGFVGGGGGLFAAGAGGATGQLTYEVGESILVYFVLTHPFTGEIIPDAVVSAAISRPVEGEYTEILFFDVAPFNEEAGEYQVEVDTTGWEPGVYDVWVGTGALDQFEHTQVTLVAPSE